MEKKKSKGSVKVKNQDGRRDTQGMNGEPKKGGHGGKFTWSGGQTDYEKDLFIGADVEAKDPNFEDPPEILLQERSSA